ncbi:hypothetical protein JOB18_005382 [Solea senegalensis]|uniref:Uncharacterized protein n=1 Tax=Solea senegalensis TaxID=28829 RepID=A0AAV6PRQ8_SOLSE|nr:hypothetical protein JOB18_005382 [Solea senegalensis]
MTTQAILRVILGPDNSQRVTFSAGLPSTVAEMETNIKTQCQIMEPFRLQFMDAVFGNEFMNLISIEEIQDKATHPANLKTKVNSFSFPSTSAPDDTSFSSGDSTLIISSPESTSSWASWPDLFCVPRFTYDAEIKLEKANKAFRENGMLLIPDPKLKSDILEGLIQEVVKHTVYLTDTRQYHSYLDDQRRALEQEKRGENRKALADDLDDLKRKKLKKLNPLGNSPSSPNQTVCIALPKKRGFLFKSSTSTLMRNLQR